MKIILDKYDEHHRSIVAIEDNAISAADVMWARSYLDRIPDFRGGMTSWGKAISASPKMVRFGIFWCTLERPR